MPVGWLTMGTPDDLRELMNTDPDRFEAVMDSRVSDAGGVLIEILWEQSGSSTYVIVGVPATDPDRVYQKLETTFGTSVRRLWNLQELKRHRPTAE